MAFIVIKSKHPEIPPLALSNLPALTIRTGTWKYLQPRYQDKTGPCRLGCPNGNPIPYALYLVRLGEMQQAWELWRKENPLPAVCGRVCHHPCEGMCNRKDFDEPVSINSLERFIGDFGLSNQCKHPKPKAPVYPEKIAIVGSGPAGISCAYHLTQMGYKTIIFEAYNEPGGILRLGIPSFRLPKDILAKELDGVFSLGIEVKTGIHIGRDIELGKLLSEYQAVFLAPGAHKSRNLGVEGEDAEGVLSGLEFLKRINLEGKIDLNGKKVAVIGGGNTAIDTARTALRCGADVQILYRRTRNEMPAIPSEVDEAIAEGIPIEFLTAPTCIFTQNGKVVGLEVISMQLGEPDASGRRRPIPIPGSERKIDIDLIFSAIGEYPDISYIPTEYTKYDMIKIESDYSTDIKGLFAGGDVVDQPRTVIDAIKSGKMSAISIHYYLRNGMLPSKISFKIAKEGAISMERFLQGKPFSDEEQAVVMIDGININYFTKSKRKRLTELEYKTRIHNFDETRIGFDEFDAYQEAERCFNCGFCNRCNNCFYFCPDVAISKKEDGYEIDLDHCKGCGICAEECPRNAINIETVEYKEK